MRLAAATAMMIVALIHVQFSIPVGVVDSVFDAKLTFT